jgi:hypothetical protein
MKRLLLVVAIAGCGGGPINGSTGAAACITANACGIVFGSVTSCAQQVANINDSYIAAGAQYSPSMVSCIAGAGHDCAAARKCLNDGKTPQSCTGGGSCSGSVINGCSTAAGGGGMPGTTTFDCNIDGEMCVVFNGNLGCGIGTCTGEMCIGDIYQNCTAGIMRHQDCSKYNATCAASNIGPATFYHCRGKGPACAQSDSTKGIRCEGNTAIYCFDGQEAQVSCGPLGQSCFPNVRASGAFGCGLGSDCDPSTYPDSCMNGVLTFCNNGKIDTYDCTGKGFSGCNVANSGGCVL